MLKPFHSSFFRRMATSDLTAQINVSMKNKGSMFNYTPSTTAKIQLRETNFSDMTTAPLLQIDRNFNLDVRDGQVYSYPTKYGLVNYQFNAKLSSVQSLHFDNQMSDDKRVEIEKTRQFLIDLQHLSKSQRPNALYSNHEPSEVLQRLQALGITSDKTFTLNGDSKRYRLDPYGIVHEADPEIEAMKKKDWRQYGHTKDTLFIIQGKEYRMDENGKLPLPDDYIHKFEEVQIIKP